MFDLDDEGEGEGFKFPVPPSGNTNYGIGKSGNDKKPPQQNVALAEEVEFGDKNEQGTKLDLSGNTYQSGTEGTYHPTQSNTQQHPKDPTQTKEPIVVEGGGDSVEKDAKANLHDFIGYVQHARLKHALAFEHYLARSFWFSFIPICALNFIAGVIALVSSTSIDDRPDVKYFTPAPIDLTESFDVEGPSSRRLVGYPQWAKAFFDDLDKKAILVLISGIINLFLNFMNAYELTLNYRGRASMHKAATLQLAKLAFRLIRLDADDTISESEIHQEVTGLEETFEDIQNSCDSILPAKIDEAFTILQNEYKTNLLYQSERIRDMYKNEHELIFMTSTQLRGAICGFILYPLYLPSTDWSVNQAWRRINAVIASQNDGGKEKSCGWYVPKPSYRFLFVVLLIVVLAAGIGIAVGSEKKSDCWPDGNLCKGLQLPETDACTFYPEDCCLNCCDGYWSTSNSQGICGGMNRPPAPPPTFDEVPEEPPEETCWPNGTPCSAGTTCRDFCCNKYSLWSTKRSWACGRDGEIIEESECWPNGTPCSADNEGDTCRDYCCNNYSWWSTKRSWACGRDPSNLNGEIIEEPDWV